MATSDETFPKAVVVITVGMVVPAALVALAKDLFVSSLSYGAFLSMLAVGFGIAVVILFEWVSLDRRTFAFASLVWPWVVFFTALFGVLLLNNGEQIPRGPVATIVHTLYGDPSVWGPDAVTQLGYAATFMLGGVGAVAISSFLQRKAVSSKDDAE